MTHALIGSRWPLARTLVLLLLPAAWAQAGPSAPDAHSRYQREQARCMAMRVHGERANCLSEASTAHTAALPPVTDADPGRYARNAMERCKPLPLDHRQDCLARMQGGGTTRGSVAGGGIYRELVTLDRAPSSAAAASASR